MADQPSFGEVSAAAIRAAAAAFLGAAAESASLEPLVTGFSGSVVVRLVERQFAEGDGSSRSWILKQLPDRLDARRGSWVHRLMRHLAAGGLAWVPRLAMTRDGQTLWSDADGRLWELAEWMPGEPQANPSPQDVNAAVRAVARLHRRAATWPLEPPRPGVSSSVADRVARARRLLASPWTRRIAAAKSKADEAWLACFERPCRILDRCGTSGLARLAALETKTVILQGVLRDLTAEHVLFASDVPDGHRVSGIIDYHAADVDAVACDLARLLGSWRLGWPWTAGHAEAIDAYREAIEAESNPTDSGASVAEGVDLRLVPVLAASAVVFGLDNWLRWTVEESRIFPDRDAVVRRIESLTVLLEPALETLAHG